ncbi:hypothetical protein B0I33_101364 [Prauserella shujinwangii]|uniref:DUF4015 domain-containing protein n=1 Tax=Prauserella shujinwangii TaxID=1453103 RepID=A0A2T0M375_9PSEU|nr:hypothetical protein B0I33_101364 [Prauserella shujinwangii]
MLVVAVLTVGAVSVVVWTRPDVTVTGLAEDAVVSPSTLRTMAVRTGDPGAAEVLLNGEQAPVIRDGDLLRLDSPELADGAHRLEVRVPGAMAWLPGGGTSIEFTVDGTPPELALEPVKPVAPGESGELRGLARDAESVRVGGEPVPVAGDGRFSAPVDSRAGTVTVEARDAAGNTATERATVPLRHPGMRAVHLTASAWASATLRDPVLRMAREGRIDTVQLDIKDESGEVGYDSQVPLAREIGATRGLYDARAALDRLHELGVRVVGRIVVFRDPILAEASWHGGQRDRVVQTTGGQPWTGGYGEYAFTNLAHPDVRAYNIALAEEAARLGFDDILYDYIRRPDGDRSSMRFPGLEGSAADAVTGFLEETRTAVREHGTLLGASVFGIAASRPEQIAQDIPAMARHADYIAPMVYPSHWGPGEYGVADPESQPYDITARSLAHFAKLTEGRADVIPWLQAFSLRENYGPEEIRAQIRAAADNGMDSFLLWNARCRYDPAALSPGR